MALDVGLDDLGRGQLPLTDRGRELDRRALGNRLRHGVQMILITASAKCS